LQIKNKLTVISGSKIESLKAIHNRSYKQGDVIMSLNTCR